MVWKSKVQGLYTSLLHNVCLPEIDVIAELYERAIGGLLKESQLLFFAYADYEEERMKYDNVKKIYDRLLAIENVDPTLVSHFRSI